MLPWKKKKKKEKHPEVCAIDILPDEVLLLIFNLLTLKKRAHQESDDFELTNSEDSESDPRRLLSVRRVCKRWGRICQEESLGLIRWAEEAAEAKLPQSGNFKTKITEVTLSEDVATKAIAVDYKERTIYVGCGSTISVFKCRESPQSSSSADRKKLFSCVQVFSCRLSKVTCMSWWQQRNMLCVGGEGGLQVFSTQGYIVKKKLNKHYNILGICAFKDTFIFALRDMVSQIKVERWTLGSKQGTPFLSLSSRLEVMQQIEAWEDRNLLVILATRVVVLVDVNTQASRKLNFSSLATYSEEHYMACCVVSEEQYRAQNCSRAYGEPSNATKHLYVVGKVKNGNNALIYLLNEERVPLTQTGASLELWGYRLASLRMGKVLAALPWRGLFVVAGTGTYSQSVIHFLNMKGKRLPNLQITMNDRIMDMKVCPDGRLAILAAANFWLVEPILLLPIS